MSPLALRADETRAGKRVSAKGTGQSTRSYRARPGASLTLNWHGNGCEYPNSAAVSISSAQTSAGHPLHPVWRWRNGWIARLRTGWPGPFHYVESARTSTHPLPMTAAGRGPGEQLALPEAMQRGPGPPPGRGRRVPPEYLPERATPVPNSGSCSSPAWRPGCAVMCN